MRSVEEGVTAKCTEDMCRMNKGEGRLLGWHRSCRGQLAMKSNVDDRHRKSTKGS